MPDEVIQWAWMLFMLFCAASQPYAEYANVFKISNAPFTICQMSSGNMVRINESPNMTSAVYCGCEARNQIKVREKQ